MQLWKGTRVRIFFCVVHQLRYENHLYLAPLRNLIWNLIWPSRFNVISSVACSRFEFLFRQGSLFLALCLPSCLRFIIYTALIVVKGVIRRYNLDINFVAVRNYNILSRNLIGIAAVYDLFNPFEASDFVFDNFRCSRLQRVAVYGLLN